MAASTVESHGGRNHRRPIFWQAGSRRDAPGDLCENRAIGAAAQRFLALPGQHQRKRQE
jgi:hypothetical protein